MDTNVQIPLKISIKARYIFANFSSIGSISDEERSIDRRTGIVFL